MLLSEGQMSDFKGAALMFEAMPNTKVLIGDRGYDADWLRQALAARKITRVHPLQGQPQGADPARCGALPQAPQDRDHVRSS